MAEGILKREVTPSLKEEEKEEEVQVRMGYEPRQEGQEGQVTHPLLEFDKLSGQRRKPPWWEDGCGRDQSTRMTRRSI